jgi:hypothetical protein
MIDKGHPIFNDSDEQVVRKASPLVDAFGRLSAGLDRIDDALENARRSLEPLTPEQDAILCENPKDSVDDASQHVRAVRGYATHAHRLADELNALINSLDV